MGRARPKIKPGDIISGSLYLKLIEDYKVYDAKQKKIIKRLQTDLDYLMFENPDGKKILDCKHELETLRRRITQLRKDNELLICRIANMQKTKYDG